MLIKFSVLLQTKIILLCRFSLAGGWAGRGHLYLPIWQHYCELYLLTGNLAGLIFFLSNKTYPQFLLTRLHGSQVEHTSSAYWMMNIFLSHDLKLFIYSVWNQRKGLILAQLSAIELTKSKWGFFFVNFIEIHSAFQELKISFLS